MQLSSVLANWEEYATIKQWKKGLKSNSRKNRLSKKTEEAIRTWAPLFIEFTQKTPDEIIEEALAGKHVVRERLSDLCSWLQDEKGKKFNAAIHGSYHMMRSFYSHNDINTQKIRTPKVQPSEVQYLDDMVPLFEIITVEHDGKKIKQKKLRREFLRTFFEFLPPRDRLIALCIKDTGLDSGDILELPLAIIRYQDPDSERIFIRYIRSKTSEIVSTFISKETTKLVYRYIKQYRSNASDEEPLFAETIEEFKREFYRKHGRPFDPQRDELKLGSVDPHTLSGIFRRATERLEKALSADGKPVKLLIDKKQSPLRPKRFRKLFSNACNDAGIPTDIKRIFMGKADASNKPYDDKGRMDLEIYYERLEPKLVIYSEGEDSDEFLKVKSQFEKKQTELQSQVDSLTETVKWMLKNKDAKESLDALPDAEPTNKSDR